MELNKLVIAGMVVLSLCFPAVADTIYLKKGHEYEGRREFKGKVIHQSERAVGFQLEDGTILGFGIESIEKVVKGQVSEEKETEKVIKEQVSEEKTTEKVIKKQEKKQPPELSEAVETDAGQPDVQEEEDKAAAVVNESQKEPSAQKPTGSLGGRSIIGIVLGCIGWIICLIASIWLLVVAFQESILWGLGCIFIPFVSLIFVILHWKDAARPFKTSLLGIAIFLAGRFFL